MTDLAMHTASPLEERITYAKALAASDLLPGAYRGKPANVLIALELGAALGISPTTALYGINVIQGKPTLGAETMRAVVLAHGHRFDVLSVTEEEAVVRVARRERPDDTSDFAFTIADARRAGLLSGNYEKYPKAMLLARVSSQACRAIFPDVLAGVSYTPEELEPRVVRPLTPAEQADARADFGPGTWVEVEATEAVLVEVEEQYAAAVETAPWDVTDAEVVEEVPPAPQAAVPTVEEVVDHVTKTRAYNLMRQAGYTGRRQMVDFAASVLARDPKGLDLSSLGTADFEAICQELSAEPAEPEPDVDEAALAYEEGR